MSNNFDVDVSSTIVSRFILGSSCLYAQAIRTILVLEIHIFYIHTEWDIFFNGKNTNLLLL